jgi:hypothetical protein
MGNSSKRDGAAIASAERAKKALALRRAGLSYEAIGRELGISKPSAFKMIARAIDAIPREEAELVRALELSRLDALLRGLWERAVKGSDTAVASVLRVMDRRAKLLGLDAPTRRELSGPDGGPLEVLDVRKLTDDELDDAIAGRRGDASAPRGGGAAP